MLNWRDRITVDKIKVPTPVLMVRRDKERLGPQTQLQFMPSRSDYRRVNASIARTARCLQVLREPGDLLDKRALWNLGF